ncbi:hypothetical protein M5689_019046 [Euphorbia peplus]|nr:hypothetical protein M5689_019046 [Euphorbia peplus]
MGGMMENLSLQGEEDVAVELPDLEETVPVATFDLCLVGRFLTDWSLHFPSMQHRLASIWSPGKRMSVQQLAGKRYLF